eukprot:12076833-Alexandrium_andersonii.AAC.1
MDTVPSCRDLESASMADVPLPPPGPGARGHAISAGFSARRSSALEAVAKSCSSPAWLTRTNASGPGQIHLR